MDAELLATISEMVVNSARQSPDLSLFVSVPEAAQLLRVSENTVWELIDSNEIPARSLRRRKVVPRVWLLAMAAETVALGIAGRVPDNRARGRRRPTATASVFAPALPDAKTARAERQSEALAPTRRALDSVRRADPIWRPTPQDAYLWPLPGRSAREVGPGARDARIRQAPARSPNSSFGRIRRMA